MNKSVSRRYFQKALLSVASLMAMGGWHMTTYAAEDKLKVVASFSILADMVAEIGGDDVDVSVIVGRGADAHGFEPTPNDTRKLTHADVLFVNGLGFEAWLPRLVAASEFKGKEVVVSQGVQTLAFAGHAHDHGHEHEHEHEVHGGDAHEATHAHDHGSQDPHAWQDPANGVIYAKNIAEGLAAADPEDAADYRARAQAYIAQIQDVDAETRQALKNIPEGNRTLVTSHDAFGYFSRAYGIRFLSAVGVSSQAEASARDVAQLIDQVKRDGIKAVFVENVTNPKVIEQIARETGARMGGTLYADSLASKEEPAGTYLGMLHWNATQIVQALHAQ